MPELRQDDQKLIQEKALSINLDSNKYGAFVEIGAGQEVARQFFSAGGAAGTIAKTMSAYDMKVSDAIYGKASRYVSSDRVEQMLRTEYDLLSSRLGDERPKESQFFTYAATVTARSYMQKNECHGWIGILVQLFPNSPPSKIVLHVRMLDETNLEQCEALGVLGVNLVHGAYNHFTNPKKLIEGLKDGLNTDRLEIDTINFSGPCFEHIDNRLINLYLIRSWCCRAVMFSPEGHSLVPGSILRKDNTLVIRGSFKPPTKVTVDMIEGAKKQFVQEERVDPDSVHIVTELTLHESPNGDVSSDEDFLARVDLMNSLGYTVLVSDYFRFFRLRSFLRRYNKDELAVVLSVLDFDALFDEKYYDRLEGGILEAMGKLFSDNTYIYIYPSIVDGKLTTLDNVSVTPEQKYLLKHLISNGKMSAVSEYDEDNLHISSKAVFSKIKSADKSWKKDVPKDIKDLIIDNKLFGYRE